MTLCLAICMTLISIWLISSTSLYTITSIMGKIWRCFACVIHVSRAIHSKSFRRGFTDIMCISWRTHTIWTRTITLWAQASVINILILMCLQWSPHRLHPWPTILLVYILLVVLPSCTTFRVELLATNIIFWGK